MTGCTYFSTDGWEERLLSDIGRVWSARDLARISDADPTTVDDVDEETDVRDALDTFGLSREDLFDAWAAAHDVDLRDSCPHPEVADGRCLFHLPVDHPRKAAVDLADRVVDLVREEPDSDRARYLVGARFGSLSLAHRRLGSDDGRPIQFAHVSADELDLTNAVVRPDLVAVAAAVTGFSASRAQFVGALDFTGSTFGTVEWPAVNCGARATFRSAEFRDEATFARVHFDRQVSYCNAEFPGNARFEGVTFEGPARFDAAEFDAVAFGGTTFGDVAGFDGACFRGAADFGGGHAFTHLASFEQASFHGRADFADRRFQHDVTFEGAVFENEAAFEGVRFENRATFDDATFGGAVRFNKARVAGRADFDDITVSGRASVSDIEFDGDVDFRDATFDGDATFKWTQFGKTTTFEDASFGGDVDVTLAVFRRLTDFGEATFDGAATFRSTAFEAAVSFDDAVFRYDATFDGAVIALGSFVGTEAAGRLSFVGADVTAGTLVQPAETDAYYDFTDASVGDVTLDGRPNPFAFVRFYRTTFDGFDFSRHARALADDEWYVHAVSAPELFGPASSEAALREGFRALLPWSRGKYPEPSSELQDTYLKAKNGADELGQNTAVSHFFLLEMFFKRQTHREMAVDGERPIGTRVSAALQYVYNLTFSVTAGYGERPSRTAVCSVLSIGLFAGLFQLAAGLPLQPGLYLRLSLQAFVALILGDVPSTGSFQLLSALEAFIGAFFIALFVFTLTRSIDR